MVADKGVAYMASRYPHHTVGDLDDIKAAGCTSVTLLVDETDWHVFARTYREAILMARERGLKAFVSPRGFGIFPSYEPASRYLIQHPDKRQICSDDLAGTVACPNDQEYLSWLKMVFYEMIDDFDPDGVLWFQPIIQPVRSFPKSYACRCKHCKTRFYDEHLSEMPGRATDAVLQFRQNSLLRFLTELMDNSKAAGSPLDILCLMPLDRSPNTGQLDHAWHGIMDWGPFAQIPGLDVVSTNPHWIHEGGSKEFLTDNAAEVVRLCELYGRKSQVWIQLAQVPDGREPDIANSVKEAVELGVNMIAAWSYRADPGSDIHMAHNPELAWRTLVETYRGL